LETALLDLLAQHRRLPLRRLLSPQAVDTLDVNASLGALDAEAPARVARIPGFRVYKLKVGLAPVRDELALLHRLAAKLPGGAALRLDANRAWSPEAARAFLKGLEGLPVECLEEPLACPTLERLHALQQRAPFPLALDESLVTLDLMRLLHQPPVRRLVLKPMLQGGLLPSREIAHNAQRAGLEVLVTTSLDSAVGTWAAAQLAAALAPAGAPLAHGLATSDWLINDLGRAPHIEGGLLRLPDRPGLGFQWA
jgi:o-succinylbenzoate synthase